MSLLRRRVGDQLMAAASSRLPAGAIWSRLPVSSPALLCPSEGTSAWVCPRLGSAAAIWRHAPQGSSAAPQRRIPSASGYLRRPLASSPSPMGNRHGLRCYSTSKNKEKEYLPLLEELHELAGDMKQKVKAVDSYVLVYFGAILGIAVGVPARMGITDIENKALSEELVQTKTRMKDLEKQISALQVMVEDLQDGKKSAEPAAPSN